MLKNKKVLLPLIAGIVIASGIGTFAIVDALTPALLTVSRTYGDIEGIPTFSIDAQVLADRPELSTAISKVDEFHARGNPNPAPYRTQISSTQANVLIEALPFEDRTKSWEEYRTYHLVLDYNEKLYLVGIILE